MIRRWRGMVQPGALLICIGGGCGRWTHRRAIGWTCPKLIQGDRYLSGISPSDRRRSRIVPHGPVWAPLPEAVRAELAKARRLVARHLTLVGHTVIMTGQRIT